MKTDRLKAKLDALAALGRTYDPLAGEPALVKALVERSSPSLTRAFETRSNG